MGRNRRVISSSVDETLSLGVELGKELKAGTILAFSGDLGAGKTTLIKGIVQGATGILAGEVSSPTFIYLNIYEHVYHFDLYRLTSAEEFLNLGFDDYLFAGGIVCIEWSERIGTLLPPSTQRVSLSPLDATRRVIEIEEVQ